MSLCSISPCPALPYLCFRNNRVLMKESLLLETQLERVFGMNIYIWYEYIFCIKLLGFWKRWTWSRRKCHLQELPQLHQQCPDQFGPVWTSLAQFGPVWPSLDQHISNRTSYCRDPPCPVLPSSPLCAVCLPNTPHRGVQGGGGASLGVRSVFGLILFVQ